MMNLGNHEHWKYSFFFFIIWKICTSIKFQTNNELFDCCLPKPAKISRRFTWRRSPSRYLPVTIFRVNHCGNRTDYKRLSFIIDSPLFHVKFTWLFSHFIFWLKITFIAWQYLKITASNVGDVSGLEAFYDFLQLINNRLLFCKQTL